MIRNITEQFPNEINTLLLLSVVGGSVTIDDINYIIQHHNVDYGNWRNFLWEITKKQGVYKAYTNYINTDKGYP